MPVEFSNTGRAKNLQQVRQLEAEVVACDLPDRWHNDDSNPCGFRKGSNLDFFFPQVSNPRYGASPFTRVGIGGYD